MADCVFNDLLGGISEKNTSIGEVLVKTRVAIIGIHGNVKDVEK
jgi:hypothetical protein